MEISIEFPLSTREKDLISYIFILFTYLFKLPSNSESMFIFLRNYNSSYAVFEIGYLAVGATH